MAVSGMKSGKETNELSPLIYMFVLQIYWGHAAGGAVGWVTALQAWKSRLLFPMVSWDFIYNLLSQSVCS